MLVYKRGKRKVIANYKFDEIYKYYVERWGSKALPKSKVRAFYKRMFPEIVKLMVFENLDYRMPAKLGSIRVKKKLIEPVLNDEGNVDARRLSVNWKKTKQYWQKLYVGKTEEEIKLIENKPLIRETNDHTNGYRLTWFWDKLTTTIKNQSAYYIDIARDNDNILSRGAKMNNLNFYL